MTLTLYLSGQAVKTWHIIIPKHARSFADIKAILDDAVAQAKEEAGWLFEIQPYELIADGVPSVFPERRSWWYNLKYYIRVKWIKFGRYIP